MNCEKYIGFDVHQATISAAVRDCKGKVVMQSILETKPRPYLSFLRGYAALCRFAFILTLTYGMFEIAGFPKISMWWGPAEQLLSGIFGCRG